MLKRKSKSVFHKEDNQRGYFRKHLIYFHLVMCYPSGVFFTNEQTGGETSLLSFLRKPASETSLDVKLEGLEREGRRTKSEKRPLREPPISYWSLLKSFLLSSSLHLRAFRMNLSRKSRPGCRETERQQ